MYSRVTVSTWLLFLAAAGCARTGTSGGGATETGPAPTTSASATAETPLAEIAPAGASWTVGKRSAFRLTLTSALAFGDQANKFDFTVTGNLMVVPTVASGRHSSLFMIVEKAGIQSRTPDPERQFQAIAEQLSKHGCFVEISNGQVTELRFTPDLPPMVVNVYRTIAAAIQVTVPASQRDHFEIKERDGTGEYTAAYDGAGDHVWSKHKLSYSKLLGKSTGSSASTFTGILPQVQSSKGEIQLAENGRLLRVNVRDELKIRGAQVPVNSTTEVKLDADEVSDSAPVQDWRTLGQRLTRLGADEPYVQAADSQAMSNSMDDARINGQTFEAVVDKLRATAVSRQAAARVNAANGTGKASDAAVIAQQETGQFVALAAMFRRRDSDVGKAVKRLRSDGVVADTLVDALSSSGSPAAHRALAELLTAKDIDPKLRQRALGGLALTPRPSPIAIQALKGELGRQPFSASALFGLGSYARFYGANGDSAQEKALGELLIERLKNTDDIVPRIVVTLQAIANSGYSGALTDVTQRLTDRRAPVRAAAIRAVQFMPGPQVDQLVANTIATDKETEVSVSALAAAKVRKPSDILVQALTNAARAAREPKVRYESVELLTQWSKERADVRDVIQRVATSDSEETIRKLAQSAL